MANQLSKGIVRAGTVKADSVVIAGSVLEPGVGLPDGAPVTVAGDRSDGTALTNLLAALDTLGLINDTTVA